MLRFFAFAAVVLSVTLAAGFFTSTISGRSASASHAGGMDAMSIDMDPSAAPANTGTSLGSQELGARVNENNILDVDEDGVDQLEIDITADGIPVGFEMVAFTADLKYPGPPAPDLCVVDDDYNFKVTLPFVAGEPVPDCDGSFNVAALELALVYQSGDGVLVRLTLETQPGVQAGVYPLTLDVAAHIDTLNNDHAPDVVNNAYICIDATCDDLDGDGVLNVSDDCPYTPAAEPVDSNGCAQAEVDEDLDGICDSGKVSTLCTDEDACPGSQFGEPVDANGCTLAQIDGDQDGVCELAVTSVFCTGEDSCPTYAGPLENDGCPLPGPPAVGGIAGLLDGSSDSDAAAAHSDAPSLPVAMLGVVAGVIVGGALGTTVVLAKRRAR